MSFLAMSRDLAPFVKVARSTDPENISSTGDVTPDASFDRQSVDGPFESGVAILAVGDLDTGSGATVTVRWQDSADDASWADLTDADGNVFKSAQTAENTVIKQGANLNRARRYVRAVVDVDGFGSGANVDLSCVTVFYGADKLPG